MNIDAKIKNKILANQMIQWYKKKKINKDQSSWVYSKNATWFHI